MCGTTDRTGFAFLQTAGEQSRLRVKILLFHLPAELRETFLFPRGGTVRILRSRKFFLSLFKPVCLLQKLFDLLHALFPAFFPLLQKNYAGADVSQTGLFCDIPVLLLSVSVRPEALRLTDRPQRLHRLF